MCKKYLAFFLLTIGSLHLSAQIPMIGAAQFFQAGKSYPYHLGMFSTQSAGGSGAGITWDFSSLSFPAGADTTVSVTPAATPAFPRCGIAGADTATICLVNKSLATYRDEDYHYYKIKNGRVLELGSDQDNGVNEDVNFQYSRPQTFSLLPFTYASVSNDSFYATYYSYLSGYHKIHGADSLQADGYGTLKIAGDVYTNCVRLRQVSYWMDSNALMGNYAHYITRYTWYSTGKEGPVLTMEPDVNSGVTARYYFPQKKPASVENTAVNELFAFYPSPAAGELYILLKAARNSPVRLTIYDGSGKIFLHKLISGDRKCLDISMLASGAYWCGVEADGGARASAAFIKR